MYVLTKLPHRQGSTTFRMPERHGERMCPRAFCQCLFIRVVDSRQTDYRSSQGQVLVCCYWPSFLSRSRIAS